MKHFECMNIRGVVGEGRVAADPIRRRCYEITFGGMKIAAAGIATECPLGLTMTFDRREDEGIAQQHTDLFQTKRSFGERFGTEEQMVRRGSITVKQLDFVGLRITAKRIGLGCPIHKSKAGGITGRAMFGTVVIG